jgi:hypothetical protein
MRLKPEKIETLRSHCREDFKSYIFIFRPVLKWSILLLRNIFHVIKSRDSDRLWNGRPGFDPLANVSDIFFCTVFRSILRPTQPLIQ